MRYVTLPASAAALDAVQRHAVPLARSADNDRALIDLLGDARFVLLGEASHGTHEFYRERARDHAPADRRARLRRRRGRGRLARRVPRQPLRARRTATTPTRADGARRLRALPDLDVAQHRRASSSSSGCASTTTRAARARRRSASTASTSTACTRRSRRCSRYLDRTDPEAARRARDALRLLRPLRRRQRRPTATRPRFELDASRARTRSSPSCVELRRRAARRAARRPRRRRGRAASTPSRTRAWSATPRRTTARCSAAACRRGTCATATWPRRSTRSSATSGAHGRRAEDRGLGAQLAPRRRPRHRDGPARGELTSASWCASATASDAVLVGFTHLRRHRDGRLRLGRRRPSASAVRPGAAPAATRRCSTTPACRASCCRCAATATLRAGAARRRGCERAIGVIYRPETERAEPLLPGPPAAPVRRR